MIASSRPNLSAGFDLASFTIHVLHGGASCGRKPATARVGQQMGRLCERPGCSEPASVAYGMRAEDLVFWLDTLRADSYQSSGVLCQRHAESMVVPRHWTLDDLRDPGAASVPAADDGVGSTACCPASEERDRLGDRATVADGADRRVRTAALRRTARVDRVARRRSRRTRRSSVGELAEFGDVAPTSDQPVATHAIGRRRASSAVDADLRRIR